MGSLMRIVSYNMHMKVAIVYDRVNKWGGAERVLLTLHEMFPSAPLYTSVYNAKGASWAKVFPEIRTSFLQKLPFTKANHEKLAFLMPIAFESFDFSEFDLVISVTSEAAKGIITGPHTKHICYLLTPTRYLWSHYDDYFHNPLLRILAKPVIKYLRSWDKFAAQRPDEIIAISTEVKKRIKKYYNRDAKIVFPPVDLEKFNLERNLGIGKTKESYFLVVSRLVPYKKVDLVIKAFNKTGKKLIVVGTGSQEKSLKALAKQNITFVKNLTDEELSHYYLSTKVLIMPQEEDFGLVAVEAQAHGIPVIAFNKGGVKDTVIDGITGVMFEKQSVRDLIYATNRFEKKRFNSNKIRENARKFSKENFKKLLI